MDLFINCALYFIFLQEGSDSRVDNINAFGELIIVDYEWRREADNVAVGRLCEQPVVLQFVADFRGVVSLVDDDRVQQSAASNERDDFFR